MTLSPHEFPELYSRINLGGQWSPGVVTLTGHDRDQDWDVQKAKGSEGASSKYTGAPVGQFQASFYLADADDLDAWPTFQALIESTTRGPEPVALPIFHPDLNANGYTEVVNGGVGGLLWDGRNGATVIVKFLEYRPPKPKPAASATGGSGGSSDGSSGDSATEDRYDPNREARSELSGLYDEVSSP